MRPGSLSKYVKALREKGRAHLNAIERWAQVLGWCKAMLWCYEIYGWSMISRQALRSLIKKMEHDRPQPGAIYVTVRKPTPQQSEFLKWSCDYFGFEYKEE